MSGRRAGILVFLLIAGCTYGPREATFAPAQRPQGINATLTLRGEPEGRIVQGELLAVRNDGLVVRTPERIVEVLFHRVADGRFRDKASLRIGAGRPPLPEKHDQLRLMSRFPQGLDGEVLERLLEACDQDEIEVL